MNGCKKTGMVSVNTRGLTLHILKLESELPDHTALTVDFCSAFTLFAALGEFGVGAAADAVFESERDRYIHRPQGFTVQVDPTAGDKGRGVVFNPIHKGI